MDTDTIDLLCACGRLWRLNWPLWPPWSPGNIGAMTIGKRIQRAVRELAEIRTELKAEAIETDRRRRAKVTRPQSGDAAIVIANAETVAADAIIITHHHH